MQLAEVSSEHRRTGRLPLVLPARCRSRSGFLDRVVITDISILGCRIQSFALTMHRGDLVVLRPEGIEGLCGVIRWVHDHAAGIEFDRPLYQPVVEHLHRNHASFHQPSRRQPVEHLRLVA
jgi:hypothetical protein